MPGETSGGPGGFPLRFWVGSALAGRGNGRESLFGLIVSPCDTQLGGAARGCSELPGMRVVSPGHSNGFWRRALPSPFDVHWRNPGKSGGPHRSSLCGAAGRLLDEILAEAGIDRGDVYITNAVKHFKWTARARSDCTPGQAREMAACHPWLEAEMDAISPELIVCLGATAAQALWGRDFRVTCSRGKLLRHPVRRGVVKCAAKCCAMSKWAPPAAAAAKPARHVARGARRPAGDKTGDKTKLRRRRRAVRPEFITCTLNTFCRQRRARDSRSPPTQVVVWLSLLAITPFQNGSCELSSDFTRSHGFSGNVRLIGPLGQSALGPAPSMKGALCPGLPAIPPCVREMEMSSAFSVSTALAPKTKTPEAMPISEPGQKMDRGPLRRPDRVARNHWPGER